MVECGSGQYNILTPLPFSACAVMPSHLTAFSIKQWLLQRLFTVLAVLRTSLSHLETEESLYPFHWQPSCKIAICLNETFSSGRNCSNLIAIDTGDKKRAGEELSKCSFYKLKAFPCFRIFSEAFNHPYISHLLVFFCYSYNSSLLPTCHNKK